VLEVLIAALFPWQNEVEEPVIVLFAAICPC